VYPDTTAASASQAFLWRAAGVNVTAAIDLPVLERLRAVSAGGASAAAEESGGLLLGSYEGDEADGYSVHIQGFEPFVIEHRYGLSFALSLRDQKRLRQRVDKLGRGRIQPVGLFRAHLRRGLYLDQRDFDLFQSEFRHPASIFLLVRPDENGAATGAVFVWEGDDMRRHTSHREFAINPEAPVEEAMPVAPEPAVRREIPPAAAIEAERPVVHQLPGLNWSLPRFELPQWELPKLRLTLRMPGFDPARLKPAAILLLAVVLPLGAFYLGRDVGLREHGKKIAPRGQVAKHSSSRPHVRPAPVLEEPRAAAPPASVQPDIADAVPSPVPALTPDEGGLDRISNPPPTAGRQGASHSYRERSADARGPRTPVRRVWRSNEPPRSTAARLPDAPLVASVPHQLPAVPAILRHTAPAPARVVAYIKPASSFMRKVPILRAFSGRKEDYVPASPLDHPLPATSRAGAVELSAKIDRQGMVVSVKVLQGDHQLAGASADALHHWKFEPARQNGSPVESEMLVRFEFSTIRP
jgi:protein TonB